MEKKIGEIKRKKKSSRVGTFFLGLFLGFILCIGSLAGIGFYAYNNISAQWLQDKFNVDLGVQNAELKKKTIKDFVGSAIGLIENKDTYTLTNLKKDFGIDVGDEIAGIDISDLKDKPITKLADAMQDKFNNISAEELEGTMDLSDMENILEKENTYNVVGTKLYTTNTPSELVDFEYKVESGKVIIKGNSFDINTDLNRVKIKLKYLPLASAISDYTNNLGSRITIAELKVDYNVELPSYILKPENLPKTINELGAIVDELYIYDVLEYKQVGTDFYEDKDDDGTYETKVTGAIAELAKLKINEVSSKVQTTIDGLTIAEVMDYYEEDGKYYEDDTKSTQITGIMGKIAGFTVGGLNGDDGINSLTIADVMDYEQSGSTYYKDANGNGIYDAGETVLTGVLSKIADITVGGLDGIQARIDNMTIAEVLNYHYENGKYYTNSSKTDEISGIMLTLADTSISGLSERVKTLRIYEVLGYSYKDLDSNGVYSDGDIIYKDADSDNVYDSGEEITGILGAFVDMTIEGMTNDGLKTRVNALKLGDVFDNTSTGVLSLIGAETQISNIATKLAEVIPQTKLSVLQSKGLIDENSDLTKTIDGSKIGELTLQELIDYIVSIAS